MQPKIKNEAKKENLPYTLNMSVQKGAAKNIRSGSKAESKSDDDDSKENSSSIPSPGTGESGNHEELSSCQANEDKALKVFPKGALHTIDTLVK